MDTLEHWKQVRAHFEALLDCSVEEQEILLEQLCEGDHSLKTEILTLLLAERQTTTFLETPAFLWEEHLSNRASERRLGTHIGPYRLVRLLGRGGMGEVFLAERDDAQYEKQVAIKLIYDARATPEVLQRFRRERQILARLEHPHIARLIDGGVDDDLPFLVMEYVEGSPIDTYCDTHRCTVRERLQLFQVVCNAVHYAHQNLIVHRDLKTKNILVTSDGTVKLLDFGIAKLLNPETPEDPLHTVSRMMTPEYASPEQIRGEPVTTATDIYSLGILLYELLIDCRPLDLHNVTPGDIERVITEKEPLRPSAMVARSTMVGARGDARPVEEIARSRGMEPEKLRKCLTGDLDNIVLMALRKEANRRYGSAIQLSDDIQRHLTGFPVHARPDTLWYRSAKFAFRYRKSLVMAAVASLVIACLTVIYAVQLTRARLQTEREAAKTERINTFLQEMLASADPAQAGPETTVREVLDAAAERVETELSDQPEIEVAVRTTLARTYQSLGMYDEGLRHLDRALTLCRSYAGDAHPETVAIRFLLASLRHDEGHFDEAESLYRDVIVRIHALSNPDGHLLADATNGLAAVLSNTGKLDEAERLYREVIDRYRTLDGERSSSLSMALNNLAVLFGEQGRIEEAETLQREVLKIVRTQHNTAHPDVAFALFNLGGVLERLGRYPEAETYYHEALEQRCLLLGPEHPDAIWTLVTLANLNWLRHRYDEAEKQVREALGYAEETLSDDHPLTAYVHIVLGLTLSDDGRPREGEPHLRHALDIRSRALPEGHWLVANTESALGGCLAIQGRFEEAEPLLLHAFETLKASQGLDGRKTVEALQRIVRLYETWPKPEQAAAYAVLLHRDD